MGRDDDLRLDVDPIKLTAVRAQTYDAGHHNFDKYFIFDPYRDPATTQAQKNQLLAKNVRLIHAHRNVSGQLRLYYVGNNGVRRSADGLPLDQNPGGGGGAVPVVFPAGIPPISQ